MLRVYESNLLITLGENDDKHETLRELRIVRGIASMMRNETAWPFHCPKSPNAMYNALSLSQTPNLQVLHISAIIDDASLQLALNLERLHTVRGFVCLLC